MNTKKIPPTTTTNQPILSIKITKQKKTNKNHQKKTTNLQQHKHDTTFNRHKHHTISNKNQQK